ncbi:uncharacterized protein LOC128246025 [Mya arenaria]|uniref:uncharacterized protein LOC128246025 n=1 Tax=Mya arenaria TaxID=6604 RepID=UPI0022DFD39E|nr:uncharacterized protein LOC128246025 [Mya arenaria]
MVPCGQLKEYLDSLPTFNRKCMLRKGIEVHKIYVDMTKGETFLDDQFAYTEFGRMVLTNGSIRAGRVKNAKQIVVARETLYCSGTTACKRACGSYGLCLPGCDKTKMRGHRCSYRIKLTQMLGFVNFWFVEELGSHDQLNGKDCDFKVNSQHASMVSDSKLTDFTSSFKVKLPTIPKSPRKLAPKPFKKLTAEKGQGNGKMDPARPDSNTDATTYNYVLGSIPNSESAEELTLQAAGQTLPSMLQPVPSLTPAMSSMLQANLINYMTSMTNLDIPVSNASNLNLINPSLVNIKQEPSSHDLQSQNVLAFSQAFPLIAPPLLFSLQGPNPGPSSQSSHSPSQSSSQGHKERSPFARDQNANIQKSLDIEAKIKREASGRVQANHETLGQVQNRIMERAKSRKSAHTMRVPQRNETNVIDLSKNVNDIKQDNFSVTKEGLCGKRSIDDLIDRKVMSSKTFKRLQTLNHVIQSDVFQKAKNRLEKNNVANLKSGSEEIALNLTTRNSQFSKFDSDQQTDTQQSYFKLAGLYTIRHVALKVMYLGHDYTGYAGTEEAEHTIERDKTTEIRYCHVLNRNLPRDIRVLAWAPIDPDFSARFSCRRRTYKYFFPKGDLNILLMEEAGKKLIGEYDFRNFSKFNVKNGITNYVRKIMEVEVKTLDETDDGFTMYELTIVGRAFLWHQIRSIFSVLFLVGKGKESVEVVDELLNIEKNPRKPQYNMSSDAPLCLYDADFGGEFEWIYEAECHEDNLTSLQQLWAEHSVKATMVKSMLNDLEKAKVETDCDIAPWCDLSHPLLMQSEWLVEDRNPKVLMERQGGLTLDEMIASHESRKQRWRENAEIEVQDDSSEEEITSRKRQRLEIDKPSHIDDKPF